MAVGCARVYINSSEENGSPSPHTKKYIRMQATFIYTHSACSESVTDKATKVHS